MKIYFVTGGSDDQADTLSRANANNRLISYYYLKDKRVSFIEDYVERGHGRYIDEDAEKVKKMSSREFFEYLLKDLIEKEESV